MITNLDNSMNNNSRLNQIAIYLKLYFVNIRYVTIYFINECIVIIE